MEGKTSGQEKTCKEQVLNFNSSTQGKSGFQESVYGTGTGLFCKPKSHIRWIPKTLLFAESCPLTAIPALSSKYGPTCMAGSRHAYSSNSNIVNSTSGVKKKKSFPNLFSQRKEEKPALWKGGTPCIHVSLGGEGERGRILIFFYFLQNKKSPGNDGI